MLNKETMTKKDLSDERLRLTDNYIKNLNLKDFHSMSKFGLEAKNKKDLESSVYFFDNGVFKLTQTAEHIIKNIIFSELKTITLEDILTMANSEDDYNEQINLVLDSAFSKAKNRFESNISDTLLYKYHKAINFSLDNLKHNGLLDNPNPFKNDFASIRKELFYYEAMKPDFDFSKVHVRNSEDEPLINGFHNYISSRVLPILHGFKIANTPEEQVIDVINKYYNSLSEQDKSRIQKILTKNNNEVSLKIDSSTLALKNNKGILKYTSPIDKKYFLNKEYAFYQTAFGLWSVRVDKESKPVITTIYTITSKSITESVEKSKNIATKFKLGIMPVWVANKMYLKK